MFLNLIFHLILHLLLLQRYSFSKGAENRLPWKLTFTVDEIDESHGFMEGELVFVFGFASNVKTIFRFEKRFSGRFRNGETQSFSGTQYIQPESTVNSTFTDSQLEFGFVNESLCRLHSDWAKLKLKKLKFNYIRRNSTYRILVDKADLEAKCNYAAVVRPTRSRISDFGGLVIRGFKRDLSVANDCYYSNLYFDHNETIDKSCEAVCKCSNGTVDCISMCPPIMLTDSHVCRFAAMLGQCCEIVECFEQVQNRFCDTKSQFKGDIAEAYKPYKVYPWIVLLHSYKIGSCLATIIDEKWLLTTGYCAEKPESILIVYPEVDPGRQWRLGSVLYSPTIRGAGYTIEKTLALLELKKPIIFNDQVQKINLPWMGICNNYIKGNCAFRSTSFISGQHNDTIKDYIEKSFVENAETSRCFDPFYYGNTSAYAETCFRRKNKSPGCKTEDGGAVVVNSGHFNYVIAVIRKFFKDSSCRNKTLDEYIKAESICPYLNWIRDVTGLQ